MKKLFGNFVLVVFYCLAFSLFATPVLAGVETQITTDAFYHALPVISGDKIVWFDNRNGISWQVYLYDLTLKAETKLIESTGFQMNPDISGDNIVWAVGTADGSTWNISVYNLTTKTESTIPVNAEMQLFPKISGDNVVWANYVSSSGKWDICVFNLITQVKTQITTSGLASSPRIFGDKVVYNDGRYGNSGVYMYNLTNHLEVQISTTSNGQGPAIYGDKIVYNSNRNNNWDVYMFDLTRGIEVPISVNAATQGSPLIHGNRIVWYDNRNGNLDVYMYDLDLQVEVRITNADASAYYPEISGDKIVWMDNRSGNFQIYMYDLFTPPPNIPPVANIKPVAAVILGEIATIDGLTSYDTDGTIATYQWSFGDGTTGTGAAPTHAYASAGTFQIALTVTDNVGATALTNITIIVQTPVQAITDLINLVKDMNLSRGITNALDDKLEDSIEALNSERIRDRIHAVSKLQKFIESTQNQSGRRITAEQAVILVAVANRIIATIQI